MPRVKAEVEPLSYAFTCPRCEVEVTSCVDLEDFTNLSFGLTVDEVCPECESEFTVEVL